MIVWTGVRRLALFGLLSLLPVAGMRAIFGPPEQAGPVSALYGDHAPATLNRGAPLRVTSPGMATTVPLRSTVKRASQAGLPATLQRLPLAFQRNSGQTDRRVAFLARGAGYALLLTANDAVLVVMAPGTGAGQTVSQEHVLRLHLVGANARPHVSGSDPLPGKIDQFIGNDPRMWQTNVPAYGRLVYRRVYSGVDLAYDGQGGDLTYQWTLAAGADPRLIRLAVQGTPGLNRDPRGGFVLHTGGVALHVREPAAYQTVGGHRRNVAVRYVLTGPDSVAFAVGARTTNRPLIIRAAVLLSTSLGRTNDANSSATDRAGNIYATGATVSMDVPASTAITTNGSFGSSSDAFVVKMSAAGRRMVYSVYLGGSGDDHGASIAVDGAGAAYVTGQTYSSNFPLASPLQSAYGGSGDAFVAKLIPDGNMLAYSTYLGSSNSESGEVIQVDSAGTAYVRVHSITAQPGTAGVSRTLVAAIPSASSGAIPWHPHRSVSFSAGLGASVDLSDGHVDINADDMSIPGRGLDLTLSHSWDSTLARVGATTFAGQGWVTSVTPRMSGALTGIVTYMDDSGAIWSCPYIGDPQATPPYRAYVTPLGQPWSLTTSSAGYTLTNTLTGEALSFDAQGRYVADTDSYGNSNTLSYGPSGPISFANSGGRALTLAYQNGLLGDVQSPEWRQSNGQQGQHITYAYSGNQLTTLTRAAGTPDAITARFGYRGAQMVTVTTPNGYAWTLGYDRQGRLSTITSPTAGTPGQAGYTPAYVTHFDYMPGQTQVVEGYGTSSALTTTVTLNGRS